MILSGKKIPAERGATLCELYRAALFDDVVLWWMEHSLDREFGGYYSLLERDGHPWATDKYMWMNGRQIWMLSHLFNAHNKNPEWLDAARLGVEFMIQHAFREDGKMHFRLTREGQSRSEVLSLYTEVFAAIALAEYSQAADDPAIWLRPPRPTAGKASFTYPVFYTGAINCFIRMNPTRRTPAINRRNRLPPVQ